MNLKSHLSNPWNNAISFLEMFSNQGSLSTGSCFFWGLNDRTFLITNWHNLAGRNPQTNELMSSTGAVPQRISFIVFKRISEPDSDGFYELNYMPVEVGLYDNHSKPRWLEHPEFGKRVDVAAIDVTSDVRGYQIDHVNTLEADALLDVTASQDVFVVGFPFGLMANVPAPIWKRGSIALDPTFDVDGLPKMLVDTATRSGMSGSVVIARHVLVGKHFSKKDGTRATPVLRAVHDVVIGIYSGRHYPDFEKAQLGIVWKRRLIEETVSGKKFALV